MLFMAQEKQVEAVNLDKLCLTQQDFMQLWHQTLYLFLHSCNIFVGIVMLFFLRFLLFMVYCKHTRRCFLIFEIWLEVSRITVEEKASHVP